MNPTKQLSSALQAGEVQERIQAICGAVRDASGWVQPLKDEMARAIIGQDEMVERLLVALLANGHVLLEGAPGLAKTLAVKTLAAALAGDFRRIQFTPDMTAEDVVGTEIFDPRDLSFRVRPGPVFAHLVLADEINRAPARAQSALLEAMQERQATIGEHTFRLPDPCLVLATQHGGDKEGIYALPESQLDRFMLKVNVTFPSPAEERRILDIADEADQKPRVVASMEDLRRARKVATTIHVDERIKDYIVGLVYATREPMGFGLDLDPFLRHGASPRASLSLLAASRARAFLNGRGRVLTEDVKAIAPDVLRHRIGLTYEAEAQGLDGEKIVARILEKVVSA